MPRAVIGLDEALKALRKIDPTLSKELKKEVAPTMKMMQREAQGYLPASIGGLNNWIHGNPDAKSRTSRKRAFPVYDYALARKGITYSMGRKKPLPNGWTTLFALINRSASGAIIETAGRLNAGGDPESQSNNPYAGKHFIDSINASAGNIYRSGKGRKSGGRLIFKAVENNQAAFQAALVDAVNKTFRKVAK